MGDKDVDAQFADIVAHWDDLPTVTGELAASEGLEARREPPAAPPLDDQSGMPRGDDDADGAPPARATGVNPPLEPARNPTNPPPIRPFVVWRGVEPDPEAEDDTPAELADLDDDDHFVPGPLAPLPPQEDLQFWGIIVGLVAGPLVLLWLVLFRPDVSDWWTLGALALTAGGFVLLVLRQPHSRDEDDPDNGARV